MRRNETSRQRGLFDDRGPTPTRSTTTRRRIPPADLTWAAIWQLLPVEAAEAERQYEGLIAGRRIENPVTPAAAPGENEHLPAMLSASL